MSKWTPYGLRTTTCQYLAFGLKCCPPPWGWGTIRNHSNGTIIDEPFDLKKIETSIDPWWICLVSRFRRGSWPLNQFAAPLLLFVKQDFLEWTKAYKANAELTVIYSQWEDLFESPDDGVPVRSREQKNRYRHRAIAYHSNHNASPCLVWVPPMLHISNIANTNTVFKIKCGFVFVQLLAKKKNIQYNTMY